MSERILRALMQLFAIVAKVDEVSNEDDSIQIRSNKSKRIIEGLLKAELSSVDVEKYLTMFEEFLNQTRARLFRKDSDRKRTALHSVRVLFICDQINKELTQRQKMIVLLRIMEFIYTDSNYSIKELEFVKTVSDSFNIDKNEFDEIKSFIGIGSQEIIDTKNHIYCSSVKISGLDHAKSERVEGLDSLIHFIYIDSVKVLFFKYFGSEELLINGQLAASDRIHIFHRGSTTRTKKSAQLFYSDLISKVTKPKFFEPISYEMENVRFHFNSGESAIQEMNFATNGGKLIGIMGGSGTGKTTLLNILNGKVKPSSGTVRINGIDLHKYPEKFEGVLGNVNQDDLLIEELTVFENLFFSAKLSLKGYSDTQLTKKVIETLKSVGLQEISRLKVGSVLEQVISGGQRKRLNIALELIREPSILFIDEPTSGLSSRDSENIMNLLKGQVLNGKLVYVVIHQPSSNIFKLFDRLLILDKGGYPVYDGIPLNAIAHFKAHSFMGNAHERECSLCGNVNPEQIFNLIDAKIVDEYGIELAQRKKAPRDWNDLYKNLKLSDKVKIYRDKPLKKTDLPSSFTQFATYFKRDLLSKLANYQYLFVNGIIAPFLAIFLSYFIKYYESDGQEAVYSYFKNENVPQFIFIAVIVAIFLGLTVSAEEINKDKKILSREKFLHLSKGSYLFAKSAILFVISGIQTLLFVLIANSILEIRDLWFEYWLVLFSTACLSNLMGLNISSAFNSAKVIYMIVPLLIIPQLLFSGAIVKFDKLHPSLSEATKIPLIGNLMVSRWAYEALTVDQASQNKLENHFFKYELASNTASWKKDFWIPELKNHINTLIDEGNAVSTKAQHSLAIIKNEVGKEQQRLKNLSCDNCFAFEKKTTFSDDDFTELNQYLFNVQSFQIDKINNNQDAMHRIIDSIGSKEYRNMKNKYVNESLYNLVTNRIERKKIITYNDELYRNDSPIYHLAPSTSFLDTHFFAPYKYVFGTRVSTFTINVIIIWALSFLTFLALYFDVLKRMVDGTQSIFNSVKRKRPPQ